MSTHKPSPEEHPHNQPSPKAVQPSGKQFRHRDRGTHVGRTQGES